VAELKIYRNFVRNSNSISLMVTGMALGGTGDQEDSDIFFIANFYLSDAFSAKLGI
jgi:hypothetical protein